MEYKGFFIAHDILCKYYSIRQGDKQFKGKYSTIEVGKKVIDSYLNKKLNK